MSVVPARSFSIPAKISLGTALGCLLLGGIIVSLTTQILDRALWQQARGRLFSEIQVERLSLGLNQASFKMEGDQIEIGDLSLKERVEDFLPFAKAFGGVIGLYKRDVIDAIASDTEISSGGWRVGERLADEVAHETVFRSGSDYFGEVEAGGVLYLQAIRPLRDADGNVIGALFAAATKDSLMGVLDWIRDALALASVLVSFLIALVVYFSIFRSLSPLNKLEDVLERLQGEASHIDVPFLSRKDEIGKMARTIQALKNGLVVTLRLRDEAVEQRKQAETVIQAKTAFLLNMGHEIRTPMNAVLGMTQLALDTDLKPEARGWVQTAYHAGEALVSLVNDILDYANIEAGSLQLENVDFDLFASVADVVELLAVQAREKGIEILASYNEDVPRFVGGDPGRFKQILFNLVENAVKFTAKGHVAISVAVKEHAGQAVVLLISVEDTGEGIPSDKIDYLFHKLAQTSEADMRKFGGVGLGLAISSQLVRRMGGSLNVVSRLGEGSIFTYDLKLWIGDGFEEVEVIPDIFLRSLRALVIDDYLPSRQIVVESMERLGIACDEAENLDQARNALEESYRHGSPYQFVVTDYKIGEEDGLLFSREISENAFWTPPPAVVLLTSFARAIPLERMQKQGVAGYLVKPYYALQLEAILKLLFQARQNKKSLPIVTRHTISKFMRPDDGRQAKDATKLFEKRILVAEDIPANRMLIIKVLEKYGCIVDAAENGRVALAMARDAAYDLILMDCQMPEMDGYEATQEIRKIEREMGRGAVVIVALTADALLEDRERCLKAGMNDHLAKPFKQTQIYEILLKWLVSECALPPRL